MSGKQRRVNTWGGKRENAGRKPAYMIADNRIRAMMRRMRKAKRETNVDEDTFLVKIITEGITPEGTEVNVRDRIACVKIFKEYTMARQSEQNITVTKDQGMAIAVRLPPKLPDPALKVVGGKK